MAKVTNTEKALAAVRAHPFGFKYLGDPSRAPSHLNH